MTPRTVVRPLNMGPKSHFSGYFLAAVLGMLFVFCNDLFSGFKVDLARFLYLVPSLTLTFLKGRRGSLAAVLTVVALSAVVELYHRGSSAGSGGAADRWLGIALQAIIILSAGWLMEKLISQYRTLELVNENLRTQALTDELTGLYNFRYLQIRLDEELSRARRLETFLSLVMLDIDNFKCYNDTHGHPAGDELLIRMGRILQENVRLVDTVARYGGEEFAIILAGTDAERALVAAHRIRRAIEDNPFPGRATQPGGKITVSMGIATYPSDAQSKEELISRADQALYFIKKREKNNVQLYLDFDVQENKLHLI